MSGDGKDTGAGPSFAQIAVGIVEDCFYNIIHDIVLKGHRKEKLLRMQSAATIAEQAALAEHQEISDKATTTRQPSSVRVDTGGATYDRGRVTLRGNPLRTTSEIVCAHCKLPRLLHPIAGAGSRRPDLSRQYCSRHPFVSRPGHDIYNNPFPTDMAKTKKERELSRQQEKSNTPAAAAAAAHKDRGNANSDSHNQDEQENGLLKLAAGGKPASYIPWHTCPNCKRSLLITRFAQHAEKCLGISGRQSSRNALVKLTGTPLGSRLGTPIPASQGGKAGPIKKDPLVRDSGGGGSNGSDTPKKSKKKSRYVKKADRERDDDDRGERREKGVGKVLKLKTGVSTKRPPREDDIGKDGLPMSRGGVGAGGGGKRDRDTDGSGPQGRPDETPRKKIKLSKTESSTVDAKQRDTGKKKLVGSPRGPES